MRWLTTRKVLLVIILVVAALVAMRITAPERTRLTMPESVFRDLVAPVQISLTWLGERASNIITFPISMYQAGKHNQALEEEVARLQGQVIQLNEFKLENERLAALLDYKQMLAGTYDLLTASVIGREPSNWFGTIILNRGSGDGIRENMTVLTPAGLVGRVVAVSATTSEVLLITDPRSGVGSLVQETRTAAIVEGVAATSGVARMIHIPNSAPVEVGQVVITSGLGSVFPKDIPVGRITAIRGESSGLFNSADIHPFADLDRLEEVLVIIYAHP